MVNRQRCPSIECVAITNEALTVHHSQQTMVAPMSTSSASTSTGPSMVVRTKLGPVQGFKHQLPTGQWAEIFLGISFAKPPIGELRFEKPMPPEPWHEVLQAVEFGPAAIPVDVDLSRAQPCSEDCLQLNIFRPLPTSAASALLPVFFYVHGGGFCSGSSREYGYRGWADNFLPEGICVVTIQYRLGPFGFLTLGDATFPGNLGLWDMALALRFVHENIDQFGGDPKRVTVAGLSAGGAAVAALSLSPRTRGKFSDAPWGSPWQILTDLLCGSIQMSGTVLAEWSASDQTVQAGHEFVRRAFESPEGTEWASAERELEQSEEAIKRRLKSMSVEEIQRINGQMGTTRLEPNLLVWGPRIDGDFLPKDFPEMFRDLPDANKPALLGLTEMEALYFAIQGKDQFLNPFGIARHQMDSFGPEQFREFVHKAILYPMRRHLQSQSKAAIIENQAMEQQVAEDICSFYLGKLAATGAECEQQKENDGCLKNGQRKTETTENRRLAEDRAKKGADSQALFVLEQYTRLISDLLFNVPFVWMAQMRRQCKTPTFLYFNQFFNPCQFESWLPFKGATHANEYPYINGLFPIGEFEFTKSDEMHRRVLVKMLASFVQKGVPSADGIHEWPSNSIVDKDDKTNNGIEELNGLECVLIHNGNSKCSVLKRMEKMEESCRFWTEFTKKYGFNVIRGIALQTSDNGQTV